VKREATGELMRFVEARAREKVFALTEAAGAGKTTFLIHNSLKLIEAGHSVIFLEGHTMSHIELDDGSPVGDALIDLALIGLGEGRLQHTTKPMTDETVERYARQIPGLREHLAERSQEKQLILVLDAVNEYPDSRVMRKSLGAFLEFATRWNIKIIFSCRFETWVNEENGLLALFSANENLTNRLYTCKGAEYGKHGSTRLGGNDSRTHFNDREFKDAWEKYKEKYEIHGNPIYKAEIELRHPLLLYFFCEVFEGSDIGQCDQFRFWDVLQIFTHKKRQAICEAYANEPLTDLSRDKQTAIQDWATSFVLELAWTKYDEKTSMVSHERARKIMRRYRPRQLSDSESFAPEDRMIEILRALRLIKQAKDGVDFTFDAYYDYSLGRYLAKYYLPEEPDVLINLLNRLIRTHGEGRTNLAEAFRYAILEREIHHEDYKTIMAALAESHPDLQEVACTVIPDLATIRFSETVGKTKLRQDLINFMRGTLIGLKLGLSGSDEDNQSADMRQREKYQRTETRAIFEQVVEKILGNKDLVSRFSLNACLSKLIEAQPEVMLELLDDWLDDDAGFFKRTVAIGCLPAFDDIEESLDILLDKLRGDRDALGEVQTLWINRSILNALQSIAEKIGPLAELIHELDDKPYRPTHDLEPDEIDGIRDRITDRILTVSARSSTIGQAILMEKYVRIRSYFLLPPDQKTEDLLTTESPDWLTISVLIGLSSAVKNAEAILRVSEEINHQQPHSIDQLHSWLDKVHVWGDSLNLLKIESGYQAAGVSWPIRQTVRYLLGLIGWPEREERPLKKKRVEITKERIKHEEDEPVDVATDLAIVFSPLFLEASLQDHHETKERVYTLIDILEELRRAEPELFAYKGSIEASEAHIKGAHGHDHGHFVHHPDYIQSIQAISEILEKKKGFAIPFRDLEIRPGSWKAAIYSAGSLIRATEMVMSGETPRAVCLNRPPGHLAGNKICLFDNIAIAARCARKKNKGLRIFVFDADAHHGKHIQETFYDDGHVFYCSIHEEKIHPGQGFVHQCGAYEDSEKNGLGTTLNIPVSKGFSTAGYLRLIDTHVMPTLKAFQPDLVYIAGGFDGFSGDPFSHLALEPSCFYYLARQIREAGFDKIVVSYEGGYDIVHGTPVCFGALIAGLQDEPLASRLKAYLEDQRLTPETSKFGTMTPETKPVTTTSDSVRSIRVLPGGNREIRLGTLHTHGEVERILESTCSPEHLMALTHPPARYGFGAGYTGSARESALEQIGELIILPGLHAATPPSRELCEAPFAVSSISPFAIYWEEDPAVLFDFDIQGKPTLADIATHVNNAFDYRAPDNQPVPCLGLCGVIQIEGGDLTEKRLIRSPTAHDKSVGTRARGDEQSPFALTEENMPVFFGSDFSPRPRTAIICGIGVRLGSGIPKEAERDILDRVTYTSRLSPLKSKEIMIHVHMVETERPVSDFVAAGPERFPEFLAEALPGKAGWVTHIEPKTIVSRALIGVTPLIPDKKGEQQ